jgi:hypothetical protein
VRPSDRRLAYRFNVILPLKLREWRSPDPEREASSLNISESGVYFETKVAPSEGAVVQLQITMPVEVTGQSAADWVCVGKVVRVHPGRCGAGSPGVAVRFDYYEIARPASRHGTPVSQSFHRNPGS